MPNTPRMATGEEAKNYFWEAVLAALLFYFAVWIGGFYASIHFLRDARRTEASGRPTKNVGCLHAVLWVHVALTLLILVTLIGFSLSG